MTSNLEALIAQDESETLEFKEKMLNSEDLSKSMAAFANRDGGKIVLGISKTKEFIGIQPEDEFIASVARDSVRPAISPKIKRYEKDGKFFYVIEVKRSNIIHQLAS